MKGEIDKDFYCAVGSRCSEKLLCQGIVNWKCESKHRKWPTPEQYREKWGKDYPDDWAVYTLLSPNFLDTEHWNVKTFFEAKELKEQLDAIEAKFPKKYYIVCACTHWGKPLADWRPE